MTLTLKRILLLLCIPLSITLFAQQKARAPGNNIEQYKIYVVEKLDKGTQTPGSNSIPESATGDEHNYLLLDTQTGKTWILINLASERTDSNGKKVYLSTFAWKPIWFRTDVPLLETIGISRKPD